MTLSQRTIKPGSLLVVFTASITAVTPASPSADQCSSFEVPPQPGQHQPALAENMRSTGCEDHPRLSSGDERSISGPEIERTAHHSRIVGRPDALAGKISLREWDRGHRLRTDLPLHELKARRPIADKRERVAVG